jgi:hypothetical protein
MFDFHHSPRRSRSLRYILALTLLGLWIVESPGVAADTLQSQQTHINQYLKDLRNSEKEVAAADSVLKEQHHATKEQIESARRNLLGALQGLAVARSFVGDSEGAIEAYDRKSRLYEQFYGSPTVGDPRIDLKKIDASKATDAITAIVEAAKNRQVVILNEAHHVGVDRVFAMRLAKELRKIGYEYLACETFMIDDSQVLSKGYVTMMTGAYSSEPAYVNFLTDAMADGWKFVSYEPNGDGDVREYGMAANLVDRIFEESPSAKVFIYAGYSHAKKIRSRGRRAIHRNWRRSWRG